jgi:hypothetical protein
MKAQQKPRYALRCLGWFLFALSIWIAVQCLKGSMSQRQDGYVYLGVHFSQAEFRDSLDLVNLLSLCIAGPMMLGNTIGLISQDLREEWQKLNN